MPLLTLDSNWSKLAQYYNSVTRDGVFSGTPNNPNVTFTKKPELPKLKFTDFDDGLIRGGLLNAGLSVARDTERIAKFFATGKGLLFLTRQVGLQLSNPALEQTNSFVTFSNNNTRLYNLGVNTLAQIPLSITGGHVVRHGLLPTPIRGASLRGDSVGNISGYNYERVSKENNNIDNYQRNNRLLKYFGKVKNETSRDQPIELLSYNGGASSFYGIGRTNITTTTLLTDLKGVYNENYKQNPDNYTGSFLPYKGIQDFFDKYRDRVKFGPDINPTGNTVDGIPTVTLVSGDVDFAAFNGKDYLTNNIQDRIGVSTSKYGPNGKKEKRKLDSINMINITDSFAFYNNIESNKFTNEVLTESDEYGYGGYYGKDIIKFRIEFLNNDLNSVDTDVLVFRAYIEEFSDGMQAKWDSYRYMGRGEDFYVYNGFTRDISVTFSIFAHSKEEIKPIYSKLNYLLSTFAPDYSAGNKMRGNIAYLTIGDYLDRQPGVFTDIRLSNILDTHWEINLDDDSYQVPKYMKVALTFKPIHSTLPRKVEKNIPFKSNFVLSKQ